MDQFDVDQVSLNLGNEGLQARFVLKRCHMGVLLSTFLPSFLLTLTTLALPFSSHLSKDIVFLCSLLVLLVLAVLSWNMVQALPFTSYFKMVDIWLIFCLSVAFLKVVMQLLQRKSKIPSNSISPEFLLSSPTLEKLAKNQNLVSCNPNFVSKKLLPFMIFLFLISYMVIAVLFFYEVM